MDFIIKIIIAFFCLLGVIYLFNSVINYYFTKKDGPIKDMSILIITKGHCNKVEYVIRNLLYATSNIKTENGAPQIIVVDDYTDDETANICSYLENDFDMVKFYSKKQAQKLVMEKYLDIKE